MSEIIFLKNKKKTKIMTFEFSLFHNLFNNEIEDFVCIPRYFAAIVASNILIFFTFMLLAVNVSKFMLSVHH